MHHALHVDEILHEIFAHCCAQVKPWRLPKSFQYANRDLAAIARTCRTFKDLALDMIWAELPDLRPLVRCLPHISNVDGNGVHSFRRQLEKAEWETLRSYTSRVRAVTELHGTSRLAIDCIDQLSNPPNPTVPFFPKLRKLGMLQISGKLHQFVLLHFASAQLAELSLVIPYYSNESTFRAFANLCPNVRYFKFSAIKSGNHAELFSDLICCWSNLQSVTCDNVAVDFIALSRLSTVSSLTLTVNDTVIDQVTDTPSLSFSSLSRLSVVCGSLVPIWSMFRGLDLPVIHSISLSLPHVHPTPAEFLAVLTALGEACSHESLNILTVLVLHSVIPDGESPPPCQLTYELLHPLTVFHNLQSLSLDAVWDVDLTQSQLLDLASSWTHLRTLRFGERGKWTPSSGLTPEGFLQLLERCRSLQVLYIHLNTKGYTEIPHGHPWRGRTMPQHTLIHLLNSLVKEDAVEALGVFFHVAPYPDFRLTTCWDNCTFRGEQLHTFSLSGSRWMRVRDIAKDLSESRRKLLQSIRAHATKSGSADDSDINAAG